MTGSWERTGFYKKRVLVENGARARLSSSLAVTQDWGTGVLLVLLQSFDKNLGFLPDRRE